MACCITWLGGSGLGAGVATWNVKSLCTQSRRVPVHLIVSQRSRPLRTFASPTRSWKTSWTQGPSLVAPRRVFGQRSAKWSDRVIRASDQSSSEGLDQERKNPMAEAALKKLGWDDVCEAVSQHGSTTLGQLEAKNLLLPDTRQGTEVPQTLQAWNSKASFRGETGKECSTSGVHYKAPPTCPSNESRLLAETYAVTELETRLVTPLDFGGVRSEEVHLGETKP
eukprot:1180045-Prorocentrum_minimum.AAC.4